MAWELRKGRPYYCRKRRQGDRVLTVYIGGGAAGVAAEQEDRQRKEKEAAAAAARLSERDRVDAMGRRVAAFSETVEVLAQAAFLAAGYRRQDRGPWRKYDDRATA